MTMMEVRRSRVGVSGVTPVILCGGSGSRLWPISRSDLPKQFLPILSDLSLYQETLRRFADNDLFATPIVITGEPFRFIAADQAKAIGVDVEIALEPERRDSALAVAVGAELVQRRRPGSLVLTVAADHLILPRDVFVAEGLAAAAAAERDFIVTFGVHPDSAETRFGYIEPGERIGNLARKVARFVEKPDLATAEGYVRDGFLWNSGNLLFKAEAMLAEVGRHAPEIALAARAAVEAAVEDLGFLRLDAAAYARAPKVSIDYAVMEKAEQVAVAPVSYSWSDIGSWDAVWRAGAHDARENATFGATHLLDVSGSIVHATDGVLATVVGCENVIVVATEDAVLVADRARSEDVKKLVDELAAKGRREIKDNRRVFRPWGDYASIGRGDRYQVKKITVKPGARLSLQRHYHRSEHWIVVKGVGEVVRDAEVITVRENESLYLPQGCTHRLTNPGKIDLELIEVQVGSYLGEDDIVRIEDVYHREGTTS